MLNYSLYFPRFYVVILGLIFSNTLLATPVNFSPMEKLKQLDSLSQEQKALYVKYKNKIFIQENTKSILLEANEVPLGVVLILIEIHSGIHFIIPELNWEDSVKIKITASSWKSVLNKILVSYSHVGHWDSKFNLSAIQVLPKDVGTEGYENDIEESEYLYLNATHGDNPEQQLSFKQLTRIANGRLRSPLPEDLFKDLKIRIFLKSHGINSVNDGEDSENASMVRIKARQLLREITE